MREIRRQDRLLEKERAEELLRDGEYGFLAMVNADGGGYGIPISYVQEGDAIYFHCAPEGHKLDNIARNDKVTFTVVGNTKNIPGKFTTAYESVMAFGPIGVVADDEERMRALRLLSRKYDAGFDEIAEKYIAGSFARTKVLKMTVVSLSAKAKKIKG